MTNPTTPGVPAGWYPDPAGSPQQRWWDGTKWTENLQAPYTPEVGGGAGALKAPEGAKSYNLWIWLVVVLPYITLPFLFTMDPASVFGVDARPDTEAAIQEQLAFLTSPAFLSVVGLSIVATVLAIVFSYIDWKAQKTDGMPRPFHWAFALIYLAGYPVYPIGRAIIAKRRTGHGSAVLWVTIALFVLTFVASIVWALASFAGSM